MTMMSAVAPVAEGYVLGPDEGEAFWFLNTLTINKVTAAQTHGDLSIVDHRLPAGFAPPPHVHRADDEVLYILDGSFEGFCGERRWTAGPGSLVFLPRAVPHGFQVGEEGPGRALVISAPGGFDRFVAELGEPAAALELPEAVAPDPAQVIAVAAAHGIDVLPPA